MEKEMPRILIIFEGDIVVPDRLLSSKIKKLRFGELNEPYFLYSNNNMRKR